MDEDIRPLPFEDIEMDEQEFGLSTADSALQAITDAGYVVVPVKTLEWWRELVDLNPQDLAPRMDARIKAAQKENDDG